MSHARITVALTALLLMAGAAAARADHAVKFDRAYKAGDKHHVKASVKMNGGAVVEINGQVLPTPAKAQTLELEADATVDEVHPDGRAKKATYKIIKAEGTDNGAPRQFLKPDSIVVVTAQGKEAVFTDDKGVAINPEVKGLLATTVDVSPENQSADRMFGTAQPQPVGGKWPANADAIKQDLARDNVDITNATVAGESELVAREGDGSRIRTSVTTTGFAPAAGQLPPGAQLQDTSIAITRNAVYPDDAAKPVTGETQQMNMSMKATMPSPDGAQKMNMTIKVEASANVERTPK